ncbi:MAG: hybrid sensor histidine kinase/response regulator [Verrucomicrobiae bacterium]|nr:hybrid sensor histidine kinase/response regulator [Verrucomicrobiae bacterium]
MDLKILNFEQHLAHAVGPIQLELRRVGNPDSPVRWHRGGPGFSRRAGPETTDDLSGAAHIDSTAFSVKSRIQSMAGRKKILVIDDEAWLREMVQMALRQRGYDVILAENGATGIELARRELPDLILCDVNMEKVDGYLTLSALRNEPATAAIPFILMTGLADNAGMRHGMELGADDYLPKPFTIEALYAAIEARLRKAQLLREESERRLADLRHAISLALPHELRTPLNGIIAYGEIFKNDAETLTPAEIAEMGQVISASARRLERLVENFLIYAQIELLRTDADRVNALRSARTPNAARIIETRAWEQARAAQRDGDLELSLADATVPMSEEYLGKVVDEIVENAFKFSPRGTRVCVRFEVTPDTLTLSVSDTGRGFSTEQIARVGAYMQFDRKMHEQQGLGLGLTIAKQLTELHGGSLTISSARDQGTTIRVQLPHPAAT